MREFDLAIICWKPWCLLKGHKDCISTLSQVFIFDSRIIVLCFRKSRATCRSLSKLFGSSGPNMQVLDCNIYGIGCHNFTMQRSHDSFILTSHYNLLEQKAWFQKEHHILPGGFCNKFQAEIDDFTIFHWCPLHLGKGPRPPSSRFNMQPLSHGPHIARHVDADILVTGTWIMIR